MKTAKDTRLKLLLLYLLALLIFIFFSENRQMIELCAVFVNNDFYFMQFDCKKCVVQAYKNVCSCQRECSAICEKKQKIFLFRDIYIFIALPFWCFCAIYLIFLFRNIWMNFSSLLIDFLFENCFENFDFEGYRRASLISIVQIICEFINSQDILVKVQFNKWGEISNVVAWIIHSINRIEFLANQSSQNHVKWKVCFMKLKREECRITNVLCNFKTVFTDFLLKIDSSQFPFTIQVRFYLVKRSIRAILSPETLLNDYIIITVELTISIASAEKVKW